MTTINKLQNYVKSIISNQQPQNTFHDVYAETFNLIKSNIDLFYNIITKFITDIVNDCHKIEDFENIRRYIDIIDAFSGCYNAFTYYDKKYSKIKDIGDDIMLNKKAEWITFNEKRRQIGLAPLTTFPTKNDYNRLTKYDQHSTSETSSM